MAAFQVITEAMAGDVGSAARCRPWKSIINSFGVSQATIPRAISLPSAPRATPAFIVFHFHETHDNTEEIYTYT
jgi:hypothetical protein